MKCSAFLLLAVVSFSSAAVAEAHPRYGGTLRVQLKEAVTLIDPSDGKEMTNARAKIAALVFDRLTRIDSKGNVQPGLALAWSSNPQKKIWTFQLRPGVRFHDGSPLTVTSVISSLANQPAWSANASNTPGSITIECDTTTPDLPALVAAMKYSVVRHSADGSFVGTGPFQISEWQAGRRLLVSANVDYYEGRPYLDAVEILLGNSLREQFVDLRLDRDDVIEADLDQARRLSQASQRVSFSSASNLMALVFLKTSEPNLKGESRSKRPASDARVRELLARSVNREAIYGVLLQKQGEPAFGLLPQWLTGYARLFNTPQEFEGIQKLRTDIGKVPSMYLVYDSSDPLSQAIAERIAVNARDVGILIQPYGEKRLSLSSGRAGSADVALVNIALGSANPMQALAQIADMTRLDSTEVVTASTMAQRFAAERSLLATYRVVPIAQIPQMYWLNSRVKNWLVSPDGGWRLEQVWVKPEQ